MWPRLIDAVRLTLGSAWLYLIAAEAYGARITYDIPLRRRTAAASRPPLALAG
jgi:hypothetical protein